MKKFLALMLVVSLLAIAGSAFAEGHDEPPAPKPNTDTTGSGATTTKIIIAIVEVTNTVSSSSTVRASVVAAASITTFADTQKSAKENAEAAADNLSTEDFTTEEIAAWKSLASAIVTAVKDAVANTASTLFTGAAGKGKDLTPRENTSLKAATPSVSADATPAQKLAAAQDRTRKKLGVSNATALDASEAVAATESGAYSIPKTFKKHLYNTKIKGNAGARGRLNAGAAAASVKVSATDDENVAFLNSAGEETDHIPGTYEYANDENGTEIMPGYVNMVIIMEAGEEYEPVIYTTSTDEEMKTVLEENGVDLEADSTEDVTVAVKDITYDTKKVMVEVDASGNVIEGTEKEIETTDGTILAAIASKLELNEEIKDAVEATEILTDEETADYAAAMVEAATTASEDNKYLPVAVPPLKGLTAGVYSLALGSFDALPTGRTLSTDAVFEFYPKAFTGGQKDALLLDADYNDVTNSPVSVLGKSGFYLVFRVNDAANDIVSLAEYDVTAPILAVQMVAASGGNGGGNEPGGNEPGGNEPGGNEPGGNGGGTTTKDPGGSSGGCSAGFSALALAVLGAFIARKK